MFYFMLHNKSRLNFGESLSEHFLNTSLKKKMFDVIANFSVFQLLDSQ